MSTCCSTNRYSRHTLWFSLVIATLVGCVMLLYISYHYRGKYIASCENCEHNENIHPEKFVQANCPKPCSSKECVSAANSLLENMDPSVDPCEDFYSFSCGNWVKRFSKHDNYSVTNAMEMRSKAILKDLLDNLNGSKDGRSEKLKMVYDSCMNDDSSEFRTVLSIQEFLHAIGIEGWPDLAPTFQFTDSSMERTLGKLAAHSEFAFINFVPTEEEGEEGHTLQLSNLTVIADYALMYDEALYELYENIIIKVMKYFGANPEKANNTWEDFKKVDGALFKLFMDTGAAEREIPDFEETQQYLNCASGNPDNLVQICKTLKYFVDNTEISRRFYDDRVYFSNSKFLANILPLMENFTQREVADYLSLRFIIKNLDVLDIRFRSILLRTPEAAFRPSEFKVSAVQWEQCLAWLEDNMPYVLGQEFVSRKLSDGRLEEMNSIVRIYIQEAKTYISNQKWIEEDARNQLKDLVGNLTNQVEYFVNFLANASLVDSLMEGYNPTNQSFLQNALEYRRNTLRLYMLYSKEIQTEYALSRFFVVNAFHSPGTVDVRIGMFLPPVFQYGLPKLLNLVSMGTTIGHEIGHEIVVQFFEDSENLYEEVLNENVKKKYQEKKKCLEEQYFEYEVQKIGMKVKGNNTSGENLADLMGIEITQQVIDKYSRESSGFYDDFELPALNHFSSKQLLYISLAQLWCSVRSKEKEEKHYNFDVHAPYDIRITGMMRNLPEFSKEFGCSSNTNMNPDNRCSIRD